MSATVPAKTDQDRTVCAIACGTAKKACRALGAVKESFLIGYRKGLDEDAAGLPVRPVRRIQTPEEHLSPILEEIKEICDISGLTQAVDEMRAISLTHTDDPIMSRVSATIESLSPAEMELLSQRVLKRLSEDPFFSAAMNAPPLARPEIPDEDCRKVASAFMRAIAQTLEDAGLSREDCGHLHMISEDISKPLHDLMELYLKPKTWNQKIKRIWRMQRIFFKAMKIIRNTPALALPPLTIPLPSTRRTGDLPQISHRF